MGRGGEREGGGKESGDDGRNEGGKEREKSMEGEGRGSSAIGEARRNNLRTCTVEREVGREERVNHPQHTHGASRGRGTLLLQLLFNRIVGTKRDFRKERLPSAIPHKTVVTPNSSRF